MSLRRTPNNPPLGICFCNARDPHPDSYEEVPVTDRTFDHIQRISLLLIVAAWFFAVVYVGRFLLSH